MRGGPSHMETFDPKPKLSADDGKPGKNKNCKLLGSRWKFKKHGESGLEIIDLLPETAKHVDKLCVLRGMHNDNENHPQALEQLHTIAALLDDLKARGMFDDTLIVWGANSAGRPTTRPPTVAGTTIRDTRCGWPAAQCAAGMAHGATDEYGYEAVEGKVRIHDWHATTLHLLGLDHERLTYRYGGRDFRLTDVHGRMVKEIIA